MTQSTLIPLSKQRFWPAAWLLLAGLLALLPTTSLAFGSQLAPLLPQEQAYKGSSLPADIDMLHLRWDVADGYFLYQDKFVFESATPGITLGQPLFPKGEYKQDPTFGRMLVLRDQVDIAIPFVRNDPSNTAIDSLELNTTSQGCADRGVCYAPHQQSFSIKLPPLPAATSATTTPAAGLATSGFLDKIDAFSQSLGQRLGLGGGGNADQGRFLPVDQAYILSVDVRDPHTLILRWDIADGYYLYQDKIRLKVMAPADLKAGEMQFLPAKIKEDEYFGRMKVYYRYTEVIVPLLRSNLSAQPITLNIGYQGCADAGLCYPPTNQLIELTLPATDQADITAANLSTNDVMPLAEHDRIAKLLGGEQALLTALSLFGIGLLLAFTPCVLPMVPILSSIIVGQGDKVSTRRAFSISLVYVLAMALTYTLAGVFAGLFGQNLQVMFQNPWIIITFSLLFVALAMAMFGFYELQLPTRWQSRMNELGQRSYKNTYIGVAIMGFLSALIVGPCVAAPLAGVLIYIGLSGDAWMGGLSLFMMSMGMGLPLLIIGTSAGKLLPRVGPWMTTVKLVFGVLLLGMAVWMLERILPGPISLLLWAVLLIGTAVYMGALARLEAEANGWQKLWQAIGLVLLIYGATLIVGAVTGGSDIFQPLKGLRSSSTDTEQHANFKPIKGPAGLQSALTATRQRGQTAMLDFYADWCVDCKRLEKATFSDPTVLEALANVQLLQADVTANDSDDQALLKQFGLFGPPAILFFDAQGQEIKHRRLIGFIAPKDFRAHVQATFITQAAPIL